MSTSQITRRQKKKLKPQSRFQRLWVNAESLASENAKLEKDLDELVKRVEKEVLSAEREMGETIRRFTYRQIDFGRRKSLLKWQREVLNQWIDENVEQLENMALLDEPLQDAMAELRAFEMGITLDPDSPLSPVEQMDRIFGATDDEDDDGGRESTEQARFTTGDLFEDEEEAENNEWDPTFFDESMSEEFREFEELLRRLRGEFEDGERANMEGESPSDTRVGSTEGDKIFKRLFRQAAAALHPDKESDDVRRQEKQGLMSQLLTARKEHDLITLVRLHEEHAEADSGLSSDDQRELEDLLQDYLDQQRRRKDDIIMQSPMHHMAFRHFHDKRPATVTRRIRKHVAQIQQQQQSMEDFLAEVKTLKAFKGVLEGRYEALMLRGVWSER